MSEPLLSGRLHPATPLKHSWKALVPFAVMAADNWHTFRTVEKVYFGKWVTGAALLVMVAVVGWLTVMAWRRTAYELTSGALEYRKGWVFRSHDRFEVAGMQSVDIVRPLWGRLLGVCELRLTVAGQRQQLQYLSAKQAARLRSAILAIQTGNAEVDEGRTVATVSPRDLAVSIALDLHTMWRLAWGLVAALVPWLVFHEPLALVGVLPWLRRAWKLLGQRYPRHHGWTLRQVEGGHQVQYGLVDQEQYTYLHDKITSIYLHQPILWRGRGWVEVRASVQSGGYGVLMPVMAWADAVELVRTVMGPEAAEVLGDEHRRPVGRGARWCTPWWRATGWAVSATHVCGWGGYFLRNAVHVAPLSRAMEVRTKQGPWQRLHRRASVLLVLPARATVWVRHRELEEAAGAAALLRGAAVEAARDGEPLRRVRLDIPHPGTDSAASVPA